MPQATMLTSSRPVQAMNTCAALIPLRLRTSEVVPPPLMNSTSSFSNRSPAWGDWSMTTTSCLAASACDNP
jgi:hypothetical protein